MQPKSQDSIQVFIRIRPGQQQDSIVNFTESQIKLEKSHFGFDKIFPPSALQSDIFEAVGKNVLTHTLDGYNACIFVYGQTGSGKTYTMIGENQGLMQRSFFEIFQRILDMTNTECRISCSYFQIYNEQIIDLLDLKKDKKLSIRQDVRKGVFVQNLMEESVQTPNKLIECLGIGMKNRHVGETLMNRESSRSHSIFTISFSIKVQVDDKKILKTPKLHFVDLAGSERQKMTASTGDRLKQAGNINKSLTTLGMVINALASEKQRNHIPYRDSKLTNLLRDSLGGNSKTFIIATISCSSFCFQETLSTLNFANRAKMVKVKAQINEESVLSSIEAYKDEIRKLKAEIMKLKKEKDLDVIESSQSPIIEEQKMNDDRFEELNSKIAFISEHLTRNPISPTLEVLIKNLEKLKGQKKQICMEEIQEENEKQEEDIFLEYLNSNNQLLSQIHKKIDEYIEIKTQTRDMNYQGEIQSTDPEFIEKLERAQYEEILSQRQEEIIQLYEEIKKLNEEVGENGVKVKEMSGQSYLMGKRVEEKEAAMNIIRNSLLSLQNETLMLKNMLKEQNFKKEALKKEKNEIEEEINENKGLYNFSQEKWRTEKLMKENMQSILNKKMQEISELQAQYKRRIQEAQQIYDQKKQQLIQQIQILDESIEFNKKLIILFQQKADQEKEKNIYLEKKLNDTKVILQETEEHMKNKLSQLQVLNNEYNHYVETTNDQYKKMKDSLEESIRNYDEVCLKYEFLQKKRQEEIRDFCDKIKSAEENLVKKIKIISQLEEQIIRENNCYVETINQISQEHKMSVQQLTSKMVEESQEHKKEVNFIEEEKSKNEQKYEKLEERQGVQIKLKQNLIEQNEALKQELLRKDEELKEINEKKQIQYEKIIQENQENRKVFMDLTKENYKLKTRLSGNAQKNDEELRQKIKFYEEKFKIISVQYQQATEVVKKLKEKQLSQHKKITYIEENQKQMVCEENIKMIEEKKQLINENMRLKRELQIIRQEKSSKESYLSKVSVEQQRQMLVEKQQEFKNVILSVLIKQNESKENLSKDKNLTDLLNDWKKSDGERRKQHEGMIRNIKKEQRMKSQNSFVEKEHHFLRQRVENLNVQYDKGPKKRVKLDNEED